jgi:hypothetical protein
MKIYGRVHVKLQDFSTLTVDGGEWSASRPVRWTPKGKALGPYGIGSWVGPNASLDTMKKCHLLLGIEPGHTARSLVITLTELLFSLLMWVLLRYSPGMAEEKLWKIPYRMTGFLNEILILISRIRSMIPLCSSDQ